MTTIHPKRRFFRYSLRTLMIVVTVFCIWLGITAKRARDQRQTVETILESGGRVGYEDEIGGTINIIDRSTNRKGVPVVRDPDPPGPEWLRRLIGDEYFVTVLSVTLIGPEFNDASLTTIKPLTDVKKLNVFGTEITDAGLKHLKGLTKLQILGLGYNTQITDAGLEHLKGLENLEWLGLSYAQITDAGLVHLKGLADLKTFSLNGTQVTDAGLEHLKGLTKLQDLHILRTQITDEGVRKFQQALPNCRITYTPQ